jgi:adenylylsulfate kinase
MNKTLWFTGLSGAGKSTLAQAAAAVLQAQGTPCTILDGDILRQGLCRNLGFSPEDRHENLRRIAEVAALMNSAGLTVLVATISPGEADRAMARSIIGEDAWLEIHVSTPLAVCEQRDPKGLYQRARKGDIPDFTGVSAPYAPPSCPALRLDTSSMDLAQATDSLLALLSGEQS